MPTNKDLKRLVRARMTKTGEAYTAARAHIISKPKTKLRSKSASVAPAMDYAAAAGMSDARMAAAASTPAAPSTGSAPGSCGSI